MDVADYRDRFPILADTTYLINHSLAAMPAAAESRVLEYARMWRTRGIRAWGEGWWDMPLTVGDQVGRIVGAPPGTDCMHQNVTVAVAVVLSCFRLEPPRNRIVYLEGEFPSVRYLLQAQPGAEIDVVPDVDALLEAIDERTLLVPLSHVLFKVAELQDVSAIQRRAEEVGAHVLLDAYQSAGAVPLDVHAARRLVRDRRLGEVAVRRSGRRLAVRPARSDRRARAGVRRLAGSRAAVRVRAGARVRRRDRPLPDRDAERSALYAATAGYDVIEEVGVDAIRRRSLDLTDHLIRLADAAGFEVTSQRDQSRRGASVSVRMPGFEGVHKELAERQILCDFRPEVGLRLGPALLQHRGGARLRDRRRSRTSSPPASHERHLGAAARF